MIFLTFTTPLENSVQKNRYSFVQVFSLKVFIPKHITKNNQFLSRSFCYESEVTRIRPFLSDFVGRTLSILKLYLRIQ